MEFIQGVHNYNHHIKESRLLIDLLEIKGIRQRIVFFFIIDKKEQQDYEIDKKHNALIKLK